MQLVLLKHSVVQKMCSICTNSNCLEVAIGLGILLGAFEHSWDMNALKLYPVNMAADKNRDSKEILNQEQISILQMVQRKTEIL